MNLRTWLAYAAPCVLIAACHRQPGSGGAAAIPEAGTIAAGSNAAACASPVANSTASLANTPVSDPVVTFDSAWTIVARTHWDTTYNGVNWMALRDSLRPRAAAAKTTGELRSVLSEMVASLKQSHFSIIPREISDAAGAPQPQQPQQQTRAAADEESGSIGATLRFVDQQIMVTKAPSTSAAGRVGVQPGWTLESVNGCALAPRLARIPATMDARRIALLAFAQANAMLSGPAGQPVEATFRDGAGRAHAVTMTRDREPGSIAKFGNLPPMAASLTHERVTVEGKRIGIIRFNIWMPVLSPQFDAAIDSLRDTDAIVIDVRGNFGGVAGMASGFAGHFVDTASTIGTMKQRGMALKFVANPRLVDTRSRRTTPFAGPVAILVDELSISTTEVFAAGIQALGRARVFGTQTSGQALPALPERLPNGDILYHAIADFLSPTGRPIEGAGVTPDVVTPLTRKALLKGADPAQDAALAWAAKTAIPRARGITP
jgi:carboxyl-terminal processing protease